MVVFVLDKHKKALMPCSEKRARQLLEKKRAVAHKMFPFTIRMKERLVADSDISALELRIDPGSKVSGVAVMDQSSAIYLAEVHHRQGKNDIKSRLESRRSIRRNRRNRKTRYRKPRFLNRKRTKCKRCGKNPVSGKECCRKCHKDRTSPVNKYIWLPPSLEARVNQVFNIAYRLTRLMPIGSISTERVKFDTHLMHKDGIKGIEYQQGTLQGYTVREYLLEKWGRKCAYCGKKDVPLEVEHIVPRKRGGSKRPSNLTIACNRCNVKKGTQTAEEFGFPNIQKQAKQPLRDAAAMNSTRWKLYNRLKELGLPLSFCTGAHTKMHRIQCGLPKEHYYDAACATPVHPQKIIIASKYVQIYKAMGRGNRQLVQTYGKECGGFPRVKIDGKLQKKYYLGGEHVHNARAKQHFGFRTGDIVKGGNKNKGEVIGRLNTRASGSFYIVDFQGNRVSCSHKNCTLLQRGDGWKYAAKKAAEVAQPPQKTPPKRKAPVKAVIIQQVFNF